jgi:hypothetical protein
MVFCSGISTNNDDDDDEEEEEEEELFLEYDTLYESMISDIK